MHSQRGRRHVPNKVGLDIGSHTIKGVEVIERGAETVIRSVGSTVIANEKFGNQTPSPSATIRAIRGLWSSASFGTNRVVLAMPAHSVYTKWLHIEAADEEELEHTAISMATRGAPFPAVDAIVDYRIISAKDIGSRTRYSVMLASVSSSALDALLDMAENAGLEPIAVDIAPAAAVRSFDTQQRTAGPLWIDQPHAHCIVGARNTTIAVVRGDALEFSRTVPVGGNDFTGPVMDDMQTSWERADNVKMNPGTRLGPNGVMTALGLDGEAHIPCESVIARLAREIQRSLRFFSSQFAGGSYLGMLGATTLSGGGALLKGLDACLGEHGVEITGIVNPFSGFSVVAEAGGIQRATESTAAYTTAVGLAIGDYWSETKESRFNLAA